MPRKSRLDAAGVLHHVIVRGIEKRLIFTRIAERQDFFERCHGLFMESKVRCYAWAFLTNHVHLLLRTGDIPLSKVMARLLTGYATYFNRRHGRSGHLFQNRYKSIICQEDSYFKELVRYIHLNPVRAHLAGDIEGLNRYRWSGHSALVGRTQCPWQDTEYTLSIFGDLSSYLEFLISGFDQGQRADLTGGGLIRSSGGWTEAKSQKGDERILGDTNFVMSVLTDAGHALEKRYVLKQSGINLDAVETRVTALLALIPGDLHGPGRTHRITRARSLVCYFAVQELGLPQKTLAERFSMTEAAITYAVRRGQKIAQEHGYKLMEDGQSI